MFQCGDLSVPTCYRVVLGVKMEQNSTDGTTCNYTATTEGPGRVQFVSRNIWVYGSSVIIVVGTVGNLLSAVVMTRPNLRKLTTTLYLTVLAAVDTLVLYVGLLRWWIQYVFGADVRNISTAACRIHVFAWHFVVHVEAWIIVCVGIERVIAVFFPHKAKQIFTRAFAARQMAVIGVILAIINSPFYWTVKLVCEVCTSSEDPRYGYFDKEISPWIDFCLVTLIPFLIMLVANSAIAAKLTMPTT